ncbi:MAG: hypothetical protein RIE58_11580 [Vicingaceae bacterium]
MAYFYFNTGNHYNLSDYDKIEVFSFGTIHRLFNLLRAKNLNLIWAHNWCPLPILILVIIFKRKDCILNYNVWSEPIPKIIREKSLKAFFYRLFLSRADYIQCHWHSTFRYFENNQKFNPIMIPWGLEEDYFQLKNESVSNYTIQFVSNLDKRKYRFFFPKSINKHNRHDLIIESVKSLVQLGTDNFVVYFWIGNHVDRRLLSDYKQRINQLSLSEYIMIIEHPFLPIQDIIHIWNNMNCALQLLDNDQLSSSILEPMLFKKELIASDIFSYQSLNERSHLKLNLVKNELLPIVKRMYSFIQGEKTDELELERRKEFVIETRQFKNNIKKMLHIFSFKPR